MPEISRFYGIVIYLFHDDHAPPHFHAKYAEHNIVIRIDNLSVLGGSFPHRALGLVMEWASLHQKELLDDWKLMEAKQPLAKITPLS